jgi:hypothetical protein
VRTKPPKQKPPKALELEKISLTSSPTTPYKTHRAYRNRPYANLNPSLCLHKSWALAIRS